MYGWHARRCARHRVWTLEGKGTGWVGRSVRWEPSSVRGRAVVFKGPRRWCLSVGHSLLQWVGHGLRSLRVAQTGSPGEPQAARKGGATTSGRSGWPATSGADAGRRR